MNNKSENVQAHLNNEQDRKQMNKKLKQEKKVTRLNIQSGSGYSELCDFIINTHKSK